MDNECMTDDAPAVPTTRGNRPFWIAIVIAAVVIASDQLTKWWAIENLSDGQTIPVIGDFIRFWLVYNPGAAFGLGTGFTWILAIIAAVVVVAVAWYGWRVRSVRWMIVIGLILGGATTHLGDRLFREPGFARGHVVDFIAYGNFFVGNVADIAIVGGAALGVLFALLRVPLNRDGAAVEAEPETAAAAKD